MTEPDKQSFAFPPAEAVRHVLEAAGLALNFTALPLSGGANNRTYRLDTATGPALLKWYFGHPADPRDRLQAEFAFTEFAWTHEIPFVPKPLARDLSQRLALFEFIDGHRLTPVEITREHVSQAVDFFHRLCRHRDAPAAAALPSAAEACFSLEEHAARVSSRVDVLTQIPEAIAVDREARFVELELAPAARSVETQLRQCAAKAGLSWHDRLSGSERCLSPSDFGFHNALMTPGGIVRFFDFEYAGWDDPAKLICDFFHQVQVPVRREYYEGVAQSVSGEFTNSDAVRRRTDCLMPLYNIKWCCIVLNEFLPAAAARRTFSDDREPLEVRKTRQLQKARELLSHLKHPQAE